MQLFMPCDIPLSFFYFGYKKAKHYVQRESSFCNEIDLMDFERNLDNNIREIQKSFKTNEYQMGKGTLYWVPKAKDDRGQQRMRPKVLFSFKDQVAWATIMLTLAEFFDTNPDLKVYYSIDELERRSALDWSVTWSFNNRLKRIHYYDKNDHKYYRTFIHFNGSSIYESFQWGLRQRNVALKHSVEEILVQQEEAYIGEADIREFYPTLKIHYVLSAIKSRFKELEKKSIITKESGIAKSWIRLIKQMLKIELVFPDSELYFNIEVKKCANKKCVKNDFITKYRETFLDGEDSRELHHLLSESLPLDLIASGFLANIVLTENLDLKIQEWIKDEYKDRHNLIVKLIRYTDDITVVSSDKEAVSKVINKLEEFIGDINLRFNPEKMVPLKRDEYVASLNSKLEDLLKDKGEEKETKAQLIKIVREFNHGNLSPKVFTKKDQLPGSTTMIEKMSQISDRQLQTMDNIEIETFIQDMLNLLELNVDPSELKDETKVTFASWRIKKGLKEAMYRVLPMDDSFITQKLQRVLDRYPHKVVLFEIYTLILIDQIVNHRVSSKQLENFSSFMKQLGPINHCRCGNKDLYQPFIRQRVLLLISREWKRFSHPMREKMRKIIHQSVQSWYTNNLAFWYEKYAMYWCYIICRVHVDPDIDFVKYSDNSRLFWTLNSLKEVYQKQIGYFKVKELEENNNTLEYIQQASLQPEISIKENAESISEINIYYYLSKMFSRSLYFCTLSMKTVFDSNELELYRNIWSILGSLIPKSMNREMNIHLWVSWSKIAPLHLTEQTLELIDILDDKEKDTVNEDKMIMFSFLNKLISLYFQKPESMKYFYNWVGKILNDDQNIYKRFVLNRFYHFGLIQMSLGIDGSVGIKLPLELSRFPHSNFKTGDSLNETIIPLHDWLFYIKHYPFEHTDGLSPLSEYEIMCIFRNLINVAKSIILHKQVLLLEYGVKVNDWWEFRREALSKKDNVEMKIEKVEHEKLEFFYCPLNYYGMDKIKDYYYSLTLFSMLKGNALDYGMIKPFYMYNWKDVQRFFTQGDYPSSNIASILVNKLNMHRSVYESFYHLVNSGDIPYKGLVSKDVPYNLSIINWIERYFKNSNDSILVDNGSVTELIYIDVDMLTKDGA